MELSERMQRMKDYKDVLHDGNVDPIIDEWIQEVAQLEDEVSLWRERTSIPKREWDICIPHNSAYRTVEGCIRCENAALKRENEALKGVDDGTEKCMTCDSMVEQVWHVSDELWNRLSGYPEGNGLLCTRCFDRKAQEQGVHLYWACQPSSYPKQEESEALKDAANSLLGLIEVGKEVGAVAVKSIARNKDGVPTRIVCVYFESDELEMFLDDLEYLEEKYGMGV